MHRLSGRTARSARYRRSSRQLRSGVSLLEVMFSIGVVMIGLVGIGALIPVGGALARKGAVADAAAQMAANASREFSTRGMANPRSWRWYDPTTSSYVSIPMTGYAPIPGRSFCLDPYCISQADPADTNYALESAARNEFPLNVKFDSTLQWMRMPRITLPSLYTSNFVLAPTMARQLFVSSDNLTFELPDDRTLGPVQQFTFLNGSPDPSNPNPLNRTSQGNISWMATIVPKLDRIRTATTPLFNPTDEYTLSIIVFDRRPVDRELVTDSITGDAITEDQVGERVAFIPAGGFYSGAPAFSGGDVTIYSRDLRGPDDLELRSGDWVMFSGRKRVGSTGARPVVVHKWYRVVSAGEDPVPVDPSDPDTNWMRDITVVGPDWDVGNILLETQVTIVRGVVEVHEKTIRLETSSMWTR